MAWTEGRALIGTGSPFPPVTRDGVPFTVDQTNNAYVFPGVGLGVLAVKARRVTDGTFGAAAKALADMSPAARDPRANLLPQVDQLRSVAKEVARAVALQARVEGQCAPFDDAKLDEIITAKMWEPVYRPYSRKR
jgi:malate dehydrogenase (oxaloacetate-decarboxylating)